MSAERFEAPGIIIGTKTKSHPFRAEAIEKRRQKGEFKHVTGKPKSSGNLKAKKKTMFDYIRRQGQKYTVGSDPGSPYYDIDLMVVGTPSVIVPYIDSHAENDEQREASDNPFRYFSYLWLNDKMEDYRELSELVELAQPFFPNLEEEDLKAFLNAKIRSFEEFFAEQEVIASRKVSVSKAKLGYEELVTRLGPLIDAAVAHSIISHVSKNIKTIGVVSKPRKHREKSFKRYLIPEGADIHIYIALTGKVPGKEKLSASHMAFRPGSKSKAPFASKPYIHFNKPEAFRALMNQFTSDLRLLEEALTDNFFVGKPYHIAATDDANTRLTKANQFIQELNTEYNTFTEMEKRGQTASTQYAQPTQYKQASTAAAGQQGTFATAPSRTVPGVQTLLQK